MNELPEVSALKTVGSCLFLSVMYVSSLYIWNSEQNRDHPSVIKKRFCSVAFVMLISPAFVYFFSSKEILTAFPLWELLGLRTEGFFPALIMPVILTAVLYLGPICVLLTTDPWQLCPNPKLYGENFRNLLWLRNHIVAPLSEEFTFRACMLPLLLQTFKPYLTILLSPLLFGIAHLHHLGERLSSGIDKKTAIFTSLFQFLYTTIFGIYSAYLFTKTGHFIAPFIAHSFCNHMGLPTEIQDVFAMTHPRKGILLSLYVIGLVSWIGLIPFVTNPEYFANKFPWGNL